MERRCTPRLLSQSLLTTMESDGNGLDSLSSAERVIAVSGPPSSVLDSDSKPALAGVIANTDLSILSQAVVGHVGQGSIVEGTLGTVATTEAGDSLPVSSGASDSVCEHTLSTTTGEASSQGVVQVACDETDHVFIESLPEERKVAVEMTSSGRGLDNVGVEKHTGKSETDEATAKWDDAGDDNDGATMYCEESVLESKTVPTRMSVSVCCNGYIDIFVSVFSSSW